MQLLGTLRRWCRERTAALDPRRRKRISGGTHPGSRPNESGRSTDGPGAMRTDGGAVGTELEMIVAIIRPAKLNDVKQALASAGAPSLTVTNVSGRGSQLTETSEWHGEEHIVDLHQKVKIECAVVSSQTADVVDAVQAAAQTGHPGDGKIFVLPIHDACRVSTNERGSEAM